MKSLLFQLAYQAASTVLLLLYTNKYQLEQRQQFERRKQRVMNHVLVRKDNDRGRNASGTEDPSYINIKATENEQCSP
jgi:hypothetical protein